MKYGVRGAYQQVRETHANDGVAPVRSRFRPCIWIARLRLDRTQYAVGRSFP